MKPANAHIRLLKKTMLMDWYYVLLFIMYSPSFVTRIVDIPYWNWVCASFILCNDVYFICAKGKLTMPTIWTVILYGYFTFVTLLVNSKEIFECLYRSFLAISFVMTLEYLFSRYTIRRVVKTLLKSLELFNYVNLISMLLYPAGIFMVITNGIYEELVKVEPGTVRTNARVIWLLGHQTLMTRFTLPTVCIALLYMYLNPDRKEVKLRSGLLIAVCLVETVIANSAGNYILLFLFALLICLFHFRRMNTWTIYPVIAVAYSFFLSQSNEMGIFNLMSVFLKRPVQISTRVPIWINTLKSWTERPFFGWGYINEQSEKIRQMLTLGNPHSSYLWALFEGGIVGIVLLIFYLQFFAKKIRGCWNSKCARAIYAAFVCTLIAMIDDDYIFRFPQMLIIFVLVYHIPAFTRVD